MAFTEEKFWASLEEVDPLAWRPEDRVELAGLLENSVLRRALQRVLEETTTAGKSLLRVNFQDPKSVAQASALQGQAAGITRALQVLADLAKQEIPANG